MNKIIALVVELVCWCGDEYIKLSPQKIRTILYLVQTSIYYDKRTNNRYSLPSLISKDAKKIYKLMQIPIIKRAIKL